MSLKKINPGQVVINIFGGVRRTAEAMDVDPATVTRWRQNAHIPQKYWVKLIKVSADAGKKLSLEELSGIKV